jgi:dihydrolipoamide dehydrogenase
MEHKKKYKFVIIGAGPAGIHAAKLLVNNGHRPLIISENIGGNYCYSGSVISNTLLYLSATYEAFLRDCNKLLKKSLMPDLEGIDAGKIKKYIESVINKFTKYITDEMSNGIDYINGKANFRDANTIEVLDKKSKLLIGFEKVIIASGSASKNFDLPNNVKLLKSDNILSLETFPKSVTVIGGGFVGCEFAVFFKRMGVNTTIVEKTDHLLAHFEEQIVKKLEDKFKKDGISIFKNIQIAHIDKVGNKGIIFCENGEKIESEQIFIAIGRKPNIEFLEIDRANIKVKEDIPILSNNFQTTNDNVYIIGDATGRTMSVPFCIYSAEKAIKHILFKEENKDKYLVPKVLCLNPDIASIGLDEKEAIQEGFNIDVVKYSYSYLKRHVIEMAQKGLIKIIFDKNTKEILGTHIFGRGGADIISNFSIIMQLGISIDRLSNCFFNHPTYAEIIKELGQMVVN